MTSSRVEFSKWHGLGNDYVIVAAADIPFDMTPKRAAALCDRHFGIGADGILLWSAADGDGFRLDIFNPDGSKAEMCGNGIRMLARYLVDRGYTTDTTLSIATSAGTIAPTVHSDGQVRVHMGKAKLGGLGIIGYEGDRGKSEAIDVKLEIAGKEYEFTFVNMGNPHCVIETQNLDDIDLEFLGRSMENHWLFPNRTNVEFMKIIGASEVAMRVWERGVGETSACGTGACAVAVAAYRTRGVESPVTVHLPGGDLYIEVNPQMEVYMTGPAEEIYSGVLSEDYVNRIKEL
jgi:diaminopimelate epimerase